MIELVYFRDCPNIAPARERLARALSDLDLCASGWEWDRNAEDTPARLRAYGSPTILVNGLPVGGEGVEATGNTCRVYRDEDGRPDGAPSLEVIRAALANLRIEASP